jgi:glutathione S-transferase
MKVITAPASPFGRKVRVAIIELALEDKVEVEIFPVQELAARATAVNPLGKIPVLIRDDGSTLYDSAVICEYLDGLAGGHKLFPASGEPRWIALKLQALGNGIGEAATLVGGERNRPEPNRFAPFVQSQSGKIARAADTLETIVDGFPREPNIGQIAIACSLGYTDFRVPDLDWRAGHPKLTRWFAGFAERPSMTRTVFRPPQAATSAAGAGAR